MCGRFSFFDLPGFKMRYNLELPSFVMPRYNIAPTQDIPGIIYREGLQVVRFQWGLVPYWEKENPAAKRMINARGETVHEKPSFKQSFARRRCLIPADGFYEWGKKEALKQPYRITLKSRQVFTFAGLWDTWVNPAGEKIQTCAIITTSAHTLLKNIHDRMPVILSGEAEKAWLNPGSSIPLLRSLLLPYPADSMDLYAVSNRVNSPLNDDPEIIEPLQGA